MADIKTYLSELPDEEARRDFAQRCGTSLGHIRNTFYDKNKQLAPAIIVAAERESGGKVTCEEARRDLTWVRVPDRSWPHKKGRPTLDVAKAVA